MFNGEEWCEIDILAEEAFGIFHHFPTCNPPGEGSWADADAEMKSRKLFCTTPKQHKNRNLPPFFPQNMQQTNVIFLQDGWRHGIMSTDPSPIAYLTWIHGVAIIGRRR